VNRTAKLAFALLVSAVVMGLAFAYVPGLRIETMLTLRRAANFVGLADRHLVEEGRAAARRDDFATALELWRPSLSGAMPPLKTILGWHTNLATASRRMMRLRLLGTERRPSKGMPRLRPILGTCTTKARVFSKITQPLS
jgi:hypothetical protein